MSVKGLVTEGRRWLRYAQEDLDVATHGLTDSTSRPRHVRYHAQQAAEKSLNAALLLAGRHFPYSHDLEFWLIYCRAHGLCDLLASISKR